MCARNNYFMIIIGWGRWRGEGTLTGAENLPYNKYRAYINALESLKLSTLSIEFSYFLENFLRIPTFSIRANSLKVESSPYFVFRTNRYFSSENFP